MKLHPAEQNYWPGYLDALINVLLNLLMLVAVFAMGLVSLNLQVLGQEQLLSKLDAQWSAAVGAVVSEKAGDKEADAASKDGALDEAARQALASRLKAMNADEILLRRQELAQKKELLDKAQAAQRQQQAQGPDQAQAQAQAQVQGPTPGPTQAKAKASLPEAPSPELLDKQKRIAEEESRLKALQERIKRERAQLAQLQRQAEPVVVGSLFGFRVPGRLESAPAGDVKPLLGQALGLSPRLVWEYAAADFSWSGAARPEGYEALDKSQKWRLTAFADLDNARLTREAFARVNSIREVMVRDGHVRSHIQVQIKPIADMSNINESAYRLVFLFQQ